MAVLREFCFFKVSKGMPTTRKLLLSFTGQMDGSHEIRDAMCKFEKKERISRGVCCICIYQTEIKLCPRPTINHPVQAVIRGSR